MINPPSAPATTYVELQVTSHFSFLRGASAPEELFAAAALMGHSALGLCDRGSVAGMVRGLSGQEATGVRLIPGSRIDLRDGRSLLLYPKDRAAWSRLTRLLSLGKARGGKGNCWLDWPDVGAWAKGLVAVLLPDAADERTRLDLGELRETFGRDAYLALSLRRRPGDFARLRALDTLARETDVRCVAMGDILYTNIDKPPLRALAAHLIAEEFRTRCDANGEIKYQRLALYGAFGIERLAICCLKAVKHTNQRLFDHDPDFNRSLICACHNRRYPRPPLRSTGTTCRVVAQLHPSRAQNLFGPVGDG